MKKLSLLTFALLISSFAALSAGDCCPSLCEPCGPEPLNECSYALQFHGGIVPTLWADRGCILGVDCLNNPVVSSLRELPRFRNLFRLPWTVGGRVAYNHTACEEVYLEFNYIQARDKGFCVNLPLNDSCESNGSINVCHDRYKAYTGYFGVREHFGRYWCDRVALFVGMKVGFIHHRGIDAQLSCSEAACPCSDASVCCPSVCDNDCNGCLSPDARCQSLFDSNTTISAGGEVGFDLCLTGNFSFIMSVGFIGNGPLRSCGNVSLDCLDDENCGTLNSLIVPCFSTEVQFPIHFGLKYNF